ncbi:uncharacterized protein LOC132701439 [Cylas formicarius]|uniref:uncharacterized protein LOC132701439 n=1 Tax=Cylas formicarius TaxID=197179 RepID=UPI00295839F2|nr:uncharacterized protein LOC132701439 [Cylas formicarius]
MSNKRINMVCYADDAAIFAENENDLQRQLFKLYQVCRELNITTSVEKTKSMTMTREPIRCKLIVEDKPIEQVMQFQYLGMNMSSCHDPTKDLRDQINKASATSGCLREIVWANGYMQKDSKIKIYKTCVRPIMTYAIETREDTNKTKRLLLVAEMKVPRSIASKTRRDHVRKIDIREQCDVQDIVRWGRQRRRQWYNHVKTLGEDRLPRVALEGMPVAAR